MYVPKININGLREQTILNTNNVNIKSKIGEPKTVCRACQKTPTISEALED